MNYARVAITWLGGRLTSLATHIKKSWLSPTGDGSQDQGQSFRTYSSYPERRARYSLLWSLAQGTIFYGDEVHRWLKKFKNDFKLDPDCRTIFNPFYRLTEFWATHIYAGSIDPLCGDGKIQPSAIPIVTKNENLRPIIAKIFEDSDWEQNKTVFCRLGAALGDVAIFAVDDINYQRTYLEVIDPNAIVDYEDDGLGCCHYYIIDEPRLDPRPGALVDQFGMPRQVMYREQGELLFDSDNQPVAAKFSTFLMDGVQIPYDWEGQGTSWEEPYPFLPLVLVPHTKQIPRIPFGQAEGMPMLSKVLEREDIATRFHNFIGKAVDPVWLFRGVKEPETDLDLKGGKSGIPSMYGGDNATAQALLAALNLADIDGHDNHLKEEIESDYPELRRDIENAAGDASGVALRVAQQRIETKAQSRRAGYDAALKKAITYCMKIGALRGYEGYEALTPTTDEDSPDFEFKVGERPVFRKAKLDELVEEEKFWAIAESADRSGVPIDAFLTLQGWPEDRISIVMKARDAALEMGLSVGRSKQASPPNEPAAMAIQAPGGAAP